MKTFVLFLGVIFNTYLMFCQEKEHPYFLKADTTWTKEIIPFPLGFAPDIPFEGYEDIRFSPDWSKKESQGFWSYVFAWNISGEILPTEPMLEYYLQLYFNGLMSIGLNSTDENTLGTTAVFMKKDTSSYSGKIKTYDTRYTNIPLTFNVTLKTYFCEKIKKTILLFRLSPKAFGSEIWTALNKVKIREGFCVE